MPEPRLLTDERIVWHGVPYRGLLLRPADAFLVPFSLVWAGGASYGFLVGARGNAPTGFDLFGLLFVAMGFYIVVGRFLHDIYLRHRLGYYVSNQRIIIQKAGSGSMTSLDIRRLPVVEFTERADGSGSIAFGEASMFGRNGFGI